LEVLSAFCPLLFALGLLPSLVVFLKRRSLAQNFGVASLEGDRVLRGYLRRRFCDFLTTVVEYMLLQHMAMPLPDRELKKGSVELLILSLLEDRPNHGCEIGKLIQLRSRGALRFNVASLYPLLYRLEKRGWIRGRWVEKARQRRRRYYRLTGAAKRSSQPNAMAGASLSKRSGGSRE